MLRNGRAVTSHPDLPELAGKRRCLTDLVNERFEQDLQRLRRNLEEVRGYKPTSLRARRAAARSTEGIEEMSSSSEGDAREETIVDCISISSDDSESEDDEVGPTKPSKKRRAIQVESKEECVGVGSDVEENDVCGPDDAGLCKDQSDMDKSNVPDDGSASSSVSSCIAESNDEERENCDDLDDIDIDTDRNAARQPNPNSF